MLWGIIVCLQRCGLGEDYREHWYDFRAKYWLKNNQENKQPSNIEAEQALIGSVLVNNDIIDEVSTIINPVIFFDPAHRREKDFF